MSDIQSHAPALYQAVRAELIGELQRSDIPSPATTVPACAEWTVKDVIAHICGLNVELLAGVPMHSIGSEEATSRQVADRDHLSLAEVIDEWKSIAPSMDERFNADTNMAAALLSDMVSHAYDLHEVLEQNLTVAATAVPLSAQRYAGRLQAKLAEQLGIGLTIEFADSITCPPPEIDGGTAITLRTSQLPFVRGVTGRLQRHEVEAFDWSSDPTDILDEAWNLYGPFRT